MIFKIVLIVIFFVMGLVALYFYSDTQSWHDKYQQLLDTLTTKLTEKDKQIEKLQEELKTYKDMERVIKIEQVHAEPREYTCKFSVLERFIDDTETFKKICISEVSRYMAEELEKDPMAYKVYFEKNAWTESNNVMIMFRLLPYPEGTMSFEEIMDEVKRRKK